jgi:hypothetical protein
MARSIMVTRRRKLATIPRNLTSERAEESLFVLVSRLPVLLLAATVVSAILQPQRVRAEWWSSAPADFEECADLAEKSATKEQKTAALADCNAKFAGRRKAGGGYTYYDFMQDRSFDIAGPNPTPEEQKYIDQQYTLYLEKQRHDNVTAALMSQPQTPQPVALRGEIDKPPAFGEKIPIPMQRPTRPPMSPAALAEARARAKAAACTKEAAKDSFSCNWPVLSEKLGELKKLFGGPAAQSATKAKKG